VSEAPVDAASWQSETAEKRASALVEYAISHAITLGTAESCTGGMIAVALTSCPGSSMVFKGSIVSYSNEVKVTMLGVSRELLSRQGAVDEKVALQMAEGARKALDVDYALSTTGIAGPGGGSALKPVGMVWIAVAGSHESSARLYHFSGSRDEVRQATVKAALHDLTCFVQKACR